MSHVGFLVEACVEAVPQSVLQVSISSSNASRGPRPTAGPLIVRVGSWWQCSMPEKLICSLSSPSCYRYRALQAKGTLVRSRCTSKPLYSTGSALPLTFSGYSQRLLGSRLQRHCHHLLVTCALGEHHTCSTRMTERNIYPGGVTWLSVPLSAC